MDDNIKKELEMLDEASENYWKEIDNNDKYIDWSKQAENYKHNYANLLLGDLGNDIKNVTLGKEKVRLPFKVKVRRWLEQFFNMF